MIVKSRWPVSAWVRIPFKLVAKRKFVFHSTGELRQGWTLSKQICTGPVRRKGSHERSCRFYWKTAFFSNLKKGRRAIRDSLASGPKFKHMPLVRSLKMPERTFFSSAHNKK